jgi:hypothetical protein
MTTMVVELYDALKAAGAPDDKAQAAAKALVNTNGRFDRIDNTLAMLRDDLATGLGAVRSEIRTLDDKVTALDGRVTALDVRLARAEAELGIVKWIVSGVGFAVVVLVVRSVWSGA